jgi:hypothetical protein
MRFPFVLFIELLACLSALSVAHAAEYPERPRLFIDTRYAPPQSGTTRHVTTGAEFQAALNACLPGDIIEMQAGVTFTGPFRLPYKSSGTGWIYIRSSAYDKLPAPCRRVRPEDAVNMPRIVVAPGNPGAIATDSMAHHYRFVGVEICPTAGGFMYNVVLIGSGERTAAGQPNNIVFDRCYIHGDAAAGSRRAILANGAAIAVIDSYLSDCKEVGADSQAFGSYSATGPFKLVNNYLEGAGENVMFGGADPTIPGAVPSDIEIRCNDFVKPLSWIGSSWSVKNLLEFKNAQRVLVEGNRFMNCWVHAQTGFALVLTPRNQSNTAPWSVIQDLTIQFNTVTNVAGGVNLLGHDSPNQSGRAARILIRNNVFDLANVGGGVNGRLFQILSGPADVVIEHNTAFCTYTYLMADGTPTTDSFVFRDNIVNFAVYGFIGTGTANAMTTLDKYFSAGWELADNLIIGGSAKNYPPGNFFPATKAAVGFADTATGDFRLSAASPYRGVATDGRDPGADQDSILIASTYDCGISTSIDATPGVPSFTCAPVPARDQLIVTIRNDARENMRLALYDLFGRLLMEQECDARQTIVPVSQLPSNVYLLMLLTRDRREARRVLVVR